MRKKTSEAKIIANRENALQSTGPKTPEGKEKVKLNALKHGLLAKEVVLKEGEGKENQEEFSIVIQNLLNTYLPQGPIEEMLVERIAVCYWRLRRSVRYEAGILRANLDSVTFDHFNRKNILGEKVNEFIDFNFLREEELAMVKAIKNCIKWLKGGLDLSQFHEDKTINMKHYYTTMIEQHHIFSEDRDPDLDEERFEAGEMSFQEMRAFLIQKEWTDDELREKFIEQDYEKLEECKNRLKQLEIEEENANLLISRLPYVNALLPEPQLTKLLRYETAIERQLYKAINQLERLQRQRSGEPVPPPINVDVSLTADN